jgi:hypothetical protein
MKLQEKVDKLFLDTSSNLFYCYAWRGNCISINNITKKDEILQVLAKEFTGVDYDEENRLIHFSVEDLTFPTPSITPIDEKLKTVELEAKIESIKQGEINVTNIPTACLRKS